MFFGWNIVHTKHWNTQTHWSVEVTKRNLRDWPNHDANTPTTTKTQLHCPNQCTITSSDIYNTTAATTTNKNTVGSATSQQPSNNHPQSARTSQRCGRVHGSTGLPSKRPHHTFRRDRLVGRQHAELYGSGGEPLRGPPRHTALGGHGCRCARCTTYAKVSGRRHNDDTEQIGVRRAPAAWVSGPVECV